MYITYWNLRENPFQNVADTRFAFLSNQHREGLARLLYLVEGRKLGGVLVGPYGVGKSMILELIAEKIRAQGVSRYLQIDASPIGTLGVARQVLAFLGCKERTNDIDTAMTLIHESLADEKNNAKHMALAIDEAQFLREQQAFEFLHLMTNFRLRDKNGVHGESAVTIILSGHSELLERVAAEPSFSQRMQLAWQLEPLSEAQTVEYVHHRIRAAGGDIWLFDEESLREVHHASRGLPRQINNICDIALLLGCASKVNKVNRDIMQQAIHEVNTPMLRRDAYEGARV